MRPTLRPTAHASGKIIIIGEHAVVHGYPAIAAALSQGVTLSAESKADPHAPIELVIEDWDLSLELTGDNPHPVARACLEVLATCDGPVRGWRINGTTDLPARAGLGSSAALTVAVARLVLGPGAPVDEVVTASLAGEAIFHGNPSGIDSHVAAAGGVLRYVRGERPEPVPMTQALSIVVGSSGIPRDTARQVAKVSRRLAEYPAATRATLDAIGALTTDVQACLAHHQIARLGELLNMSHHLLGALDVANGPLDQLCRIARDVGALGSKLTGAGGGGSIIALVCDAATSEAVCTALTHARATAFATEIASRHTP